jgi:hypothetical protein
LGRNVLALLVVVLGEASPASGTGHRIGRKIRNGHARRDAQSNSAGGGNREGESFHKVDDELIPDTNRFCTVSFSFTEKGLWYILALDWTSLSGLSVSLVYG